jgi:hypothetical protein
MAVNQKALASILGGPKRGREEAPEEEAALPSEPSGLEVAAEELLSAIESKDAKAVAQALKSAVEMASIGEE